MPTELSERQSAAPASMSGMDHMSLNALSTVLWRERQLLELLLFKLEEEQLLLSTGRTRWLSHATREVETVLEQIREAELGRSFEAEAVAVQLGLPPGGSLLELADHAPEPWADLLHSHRAAFIDLTAQIAAMAEGNRELLASSHRATQETLMSLQQNVQTYDSRGATADPTGSAHLLDQSL